MLRRSGGVAGGPALQQYARRAASFGGVDGAGVVGELGGWCKDSTADRGLNLTAITAPGIEPGAFYLGNPYYSYMNC